MTDGITLTSGQYAAVLGKPRRTILNWDRQDLLRPSVRTGRDRAYTFPDLVAGALAIAWQAQGVDLNAVRKIIRHVQHGGLERVQELPYVVVSGIRVWACQEGAAFHVGPAAHALVADLRPAVEATRKRLEAWQATRTRQPKTTKQIVSQTNDGGAYADRVRQG
jgi:DNA-binding transcriptional MerR regulator